MNLLRYAAHTKNGYNLQLEIDNQNKTIKKGYFIFAFCDNIKLSSKKELLNIYNYYIDVLKYKVIED